MMYLAIAQNDAWRASVIMNVLCQTWKNSQPKSGKHIRSLSLTTNYPNAQITTADGSSAPLDLVLHMRKVQMPVCKISVLACITCGTVAHRNKDTKLGLRPYMGEEEEQMTIFVRGKIQPQHLHLVG
jgi:hypothetical protein